MNWLLLTVVSVAFVAGIANAVQNQAFKERAEIYSRLVDCDYYQTNEYNYTHFVELSSLKDAQPTDYWARVPVYVIGPRDAHIILSTTNTPNRDVDFVYEILLGGWANSRAAIRKRIKNYPLKELAISPVIDTQRPLKVVIEISKAGHIRVFTDDKEEPLISAFDPNPLPVKYLSFASYESASVEFVYNCASDKTSVLSGNAIRREPVAGEWTSLSDAPIDELVKKCQWEEKWENTYDEYHTISELKNTKAEGYLFRLETLVYGSKDVHILLSDKKDVNIEKDPAYEIVIGGWGNTRQAIRKTTDDDIFERVQLRNLITEGKQTRVLIQMTPDGLIQLFVGDLQYKPIVWVVDKKPIDVKYVSFASNDGNRVLFFHSCDETHVPATEPLHGAVHPLLATPSITDEETLAEKCKHTQAWENTYSTGVKLNALKNAKSDEYVFQVPLYVKGIRDAHILVVPDGELDATNGYEFLIGGWGNTRALIRKNGIVLAKVDEFNVLDEKKPIKVIAELTSTGSLRLWTDYNKSRPLLQVTDPKPIADVSSLAFSAYYRELDFYYSCAV